MELCDDRELRAIILARIGEKGRITFAETLVLPSTPELEEYLGGPAGHDRTR